MQNWLINKTGIGTTLWIAGKNTKNEEWENTAIKILLHSTSRTKLEKEAIVDAGLCHGSTGIAQIYNRMYHYTGINEFKNAALYWFDTTLQIAKYEDGYVGYKTWRTPEYGGLKNESGFLEDIAGIGLSFISSISNIEPNWDECLLIS